MSAKRSAAWPAHRFDREDLDILLRQDRGALGLGSEVDVRVQCMEVQRAALRSWARCRFELAVALARRDLDSRVSLKRVSSVRSRRSISVVC